MTTSFLSKRLHRVRDENGFEILTIPHVDRHYFRKAYRDWRRSLRPHDTPWKVPPG